MLRSNRDYIHWCTAHTAEEQLSHLQDITGFHQLFISNMAKPSVTEVNVDFYVFPTDVSAVFLNLKLYYLKFVHVTSDVETVDN